MKRFIPLLAIGAAALLVLGVSFGRYVHHNTVVNGRDNARVGKASAPAPTAPVFKPAVTPQSTKKVKGRHDDPVPILMYHVTQAAPAGTPFPELWVSPADFKRQMNWLDDNGYTGITMQQLFEYWDHGYALPKKPVVVSFDDGYPSHAKVARPVLASHKWPGVLFLALENVGSAKRALSATMVKKLIAAGWEIDSHTITHPDLTTIGPAQLKTELVSSRAKIKRRFGQPADFFCYPSGKYNDTVVAAVKKAGYRGATTVDPGIGNKDEPFTLQRVRVDGSDGVNGFAAKMRQVDQ